jgi:ATP-dependent RNA helicase RhlE
LTNFQELGLAEPILRAVVAEGYTAPTPIQAAVVPAMLKGRDLVGIAQTGTGKTAAFVLPMLDLLMQDSRRAEPRSCRALILVPTRELASQVADSIRSYGRNARISLAVIVGGVKPGPQVQAMARGVDIVVATPGRLEDHLRTNAIRLGQVGIVVLDEADQMLDLGFMPAVRRLLGSTPRKRQTVLLSATMPKEIRSLADAFLADPLEIAVTPASRPVERIHQSVRLVEASAKRDVLVEILRATEVERTIVFTRTKRGADRVCEHLEKAGYAAAAIHGNKSQVQRERALGAFRHGRATVLVATDIAARGIDIDDVSHVVNFELPNVPEAYVHRIGRSGRAGRTGAAISLCDPTEHGLLRDIEKLIGARIQGSEALSRTAGGSRPSAPAQRPQAHRGAGQPRDRVGPGSRPRRPSRSRSTVAAAG